MAADFINLYLIKNRGPGALSLNRTAIKKNYSTKLFNVLAALVSLCFFNNAACAQQYYFKHYSIEDGLAQSQLMSIYQDSSRYLWFGTASGVSRFNGTDFVNYAKINGIRGNTISSVYQDNKRILFRTGIGISSLESNHITKLFISARPSWNSRLVKTNDDKLWLISGYQLFTLINDKLTPVKIDKTDGKVQAITVDNQGNIYAAVEADGIFCRINGKWIKKVDFNDGYSNIAVMSILLDKFDADKMYLLTMSKLYQVTNRQIAPFSNTLLDNFKGEFMGLEQDKNGSLWVGSSIGAFYINKSNSIHFTHENGFTNNPVTAVYCDKEDIIWLATDGDGFYKFQGLNLISYQTLNGSPLPLVTGLATDMSDNLWAATYGDGLVKIKNGQLINVLLPSPDRTTRIITCLAGDKNQNMLIGTAGGLWQFNNKAFSIIDKKFVQRINAVSYDTDNRVWAGTPWGCYILQNGHFTLVKNSPHGITALCPLGRDSMIAGTFTGMVLVTKKQAETVPVFKRLAHSAILCVLKAGDLLIAGTFGEGIYIIDLKNHRMKNISSLDGFKSNDIYSLALTAGNAVWAGTGKGIEKFTINKANLTVNLVHNVIPNPIAEYNSNCILKFDGKIWLSNNSGIVAYNLLNNSASHNPVLNIESINVINQSDQKGVNSIVLANDPSQWFKFKYGNNRVVISFKGVFFTDPDHLLYQYRLKGLESKFSAPTSATSADYTSLKPGKYQFEVRTLSALGTKSDIKCLTIEIIPAFYQTTWFYVLEAILLIVVIIFIQQSVLYIKKRQRALIEQLKRDEQIKIREQTAEDFHDDIGNKLTRIAVLADVLKKKTLNDDNDQNKLIDQIKENANALYTDTKDILWALDPQSENLVEILAFIRNLAFDIFSNTEIAVEFNQFDLNENRYELPLDFSRNISMIFREILHNTLKHAQATRVTINCFMQGNKITIEVEDNGTGFDATATGHGKGLNNIKARAQRINGEIDINSIAGVGTSIKLNFSIGN